MLRISRCLISIHLHKDLRDGFCDCPHFKDKKLRLMECEVTQEMAKWDLNTVKLKFSTQDLDHIWLKGIIRCWLPSLGFGSQGFWGLQSDTTGHLESHLKTHPQPLPRALPTQRAALGNTDFPAVWLQASITVSYVDEMTLPSRDQHSNLFWLCSKPSSVMRAWFPTPWSDSEHQRWNERFRRREDGALPPFRCVVLGNLSPCVLRVRNGSQPRGLAIGEVFPHQPLFCISFKIGACIYSICWFVNSSSVYWLPAMCRTLGKILVMQQRTGWWHPGQGHTSPSGQTSNSWVIPTCTRREDLQVAILYRGLPAQLQGKFNDLGKSLC